MNFSRLKFYCIFFPLFFFTSQCFSQSNDNAVDSSEAATTADSISSNDYNTADTVITKTTFENHDDSIIKWKRRPEFGYMAYLDSLLKRKKNKLRMDTFNITTNASKEIKRSSSSSGANNFLNSFPVKIFFWIIAIFFIGFILYKLFIKGGLFDRDTKKYKSEPTDEEPAKLNDYAAYNDLIYEAEEKNDFNLAVRYLYLQLLKKLSDQELILFSPDKTNRFYMQELAGKNYQQEFASLTLHYEYVWYGKFSISHDRYIHLKNEFIGFNKKI